MDPSAGLFPVEGTVSAYANLRRLTEPPPFPPPAPPTAGSEVQDPRSNVGLLAALEAAGRNRLSPFLAQTAAADVAPETTPVYDETAYPADMLTESARAALGAPEGPL